MTVRSATAADVPRMVEWADRKRHEYARAQPRFWRPAQDAAERHRPFLEGLIGREDVIALVSGGGFAIGLIGDAPPVYDPGGKSCLIDDFVVESWDSDGAELLDEVCRLAPRAGAVQVVVVCGHHDGPKRTFLEARGFPIASEWRVKELT